METTDVPTLMTASTLINFQQLFYHHCSWVTHQILCEQHIATENT